MREPIKGFNKFLIFSSGANLEILSQDKCYAERSKYASIGATIVLTAILAFFSGGYALYTVFESKIAAILFGLFWGITMFNLDRFLILSTRKEQKASFQQVFMFLVRLMVAIFLAVIVAKPLELKIFEKPIMAEIAQVNAQVVLEYERKLTEDSPELKTLQESYQAIQSEIKRKEQKRDRAYDEAMKENEGSKGTLIPGKGAVYQEKWAEFQKLDREYQNFVRTNQKKLESISQRLEVLTQRKDRQLEQIRSNQDAATDLVTQLTVLHELGEKNFVIAKASKAITLLFIIIDVAPIFAKILSKRSIYDVLVENIELQQIESVEEYTKNLQKIDFRRQQVEWEQYQEAMKYALQGSSYSEVMQEVAQTIISNLKGQLLNYVNQIHYPKTQLKKTVNKFYKNDVKDVVREQVKHHVMKQKAEHFVNDAVTQMEDYIKKSGRD